MNAKRTNVMADKWSQIANSPEAAALLKLVVHIDEVCDHEGDVAEFLPTLLHQLAQLLDVQTAAVTLISSSQDHRILSRYDRGIASIDNEQIIRIAAESATTKQWVTKEGFSQKIKNALAVPIIKSNKVLGAFTIINKSSGEIGDYDRIVVTLVELRMHSVIDDWMRRQVQRQMETENRVMKELDVIRDESQDQGEALDQMISTILDSVGAQIGFITLYDSEKDRHVPGGKVIRGNRPMSQHDYRLVGDLIRQAREEHKTLIGGALPDSEIESYIVVPMFISGLFLGSVVLINKLDPGEFLKQDRQLVESMTQIIDSFIFQEEKFKRLMTLVGREATKEVEEVLMGHRPDTAHGQRMRITMFFADIRDYSKKIREMDPTSAVRMLNDYFNSVTPIITVYNGVVDKYVGDELVALFTKSTANGSHQYLAVEAGLALQAELKRLNKEWALTGRPQIEVGVGIHTGEVVLGQIGSFERKDFTAIGANMNFAARLQSLAAPGQVIISEETYVGITGKITARRIGPMAVKGFGDVVAYLVEGRSPEHF
jgi:class 3 adenylate cyclase/GAF domain-containing protein